MSGDGRPDPPPGTGPWEDDEMPPPDEDAPAPRHGPDPMVLDFLDMAYVRGRAVGPKKSKRNTALILELDRRWKGQIRRNLFDGQVYVRGEPLSDPLETETSIWIDRNYGFEMATRTTREIILLIAERNSWHPVREYLEGLKWDGQERCKRLLGDYFGTADTSLNSVLSRCFLVSCVARVMKPGCKCDTVLILKGSQGAFKSSTLRALAGPDWFSDTPIEVGHKDGYGGLNGVWIYEFGELDSMSRKETTAVKGFLSAQVDRYRPPYGRNFVTRKRQTVTTGTTNEDTFLKDSTGSRRFWPVEVGKMDFQGVERDRDQLWAEALHLYKAGWTWWLWDSQAKELKEASEEFEETDPWEPALLDWMEGRTCETMIDILDEALKIRPGKVTKWDQMRAAKILKKAGWYNYRKRGATPGTNATKGTRSVCWWPDPKPGHTGSRKDAQ